ncbi:MAG: DUF2461 domain-containing protein [Acidobacteria bacterium]|nr:DUF2461 domain-containing protein [Acidobacteriota bacterium]
MPTGETLEFLRNLDRNNNREWFGAHRSEYEAARDDVAGMVAVLIARIAEFDPLLRGTLAPDCLFRIFRDTRFSKDKTPYKTAFGGVLAPGGRKSAIPGYYVQVDAAESFIAGGCYRPEPAGLQAIRTAIAADPQSFSGIVEQPDFIKAFGGLSVGDGKLVNVPRGFAKDHPAAEFLKLKSFIVYRAVSEAELADLDGLVARFRLIKPLNDFLRAALKPK